MSLYDDSECHIPMAVMADSYKAGHFLMYPEAKEMVAYGEFRVPFPGMNDNRFIFYGMDYYIKKYISRKWTKDDILDAKNFYSTHNIINSSYPFPEDLFNKFINENEGYFPVKIEALPDGSVAYIRTPVFKITASEEYSRLCTYFETLLTMVWYPSTVATLSRYTKDIIEEAFIKSVDEKNYYLLDSRLHDFGFRGCTCPEQSVIGGMAHMLNFEGSDTMSACYYAQKLNNNKPVGHSIPATEHSVMTSWKTEEEAIDNMITHFGNGIYACVMDSYDYERAINEVLPKCAPKIKEKNGTIVLRPDSGDPVEQVIKGLIAADNVFGHTLNSKEFKIINNASVIQGDGINYEIVKNILDAVLKNGYSAQNVAFGMGGGLLQKVNRDTMSFATKLSHITDIDGMERDIIKTPKTDDGKTSHPGKLFVGRLNEDSPPIVFASEEDHSGYTDCMRVVYDRRPVEKSKESFNIIKDRVTKEWKNTSSNGDPISPNLKKKTRSIITKIRDNLASTKS